MALISKVDLQRPNPSHSSRIDAFSDADPYGLDDFEAEMKRLAIANDELLADLNTDDLAEDIEPTRPTGELAFENDQLVTLQRENVELKARVRELEAAGPTGDNKDEWLEQQREYEMLLEEKSEVIRALHQKLQDAEESVSLGSMPPASPGASSTRLGQAEEILQLKREMEEQRKQLDQDEQDMMKQLRQMEMTMAKERAEMARQRQEVARLQADLAYEIEHNSRDSGLKERLQSMRRVPGGSKPVLQAPSSVRPEPIAAPEAHGKNSSGFLRRIFG